MYHRPRAVTAELTIGLKPQCDILDSCRSTGTLVSGRRFRGAFLPLCAYGARRPALMRGASMPAPFLSDALSAAVFALVIAFLPCPAPAAAQPNPVLPVEVRAASALRDSGEYLRADSVARQAAA